MEIEKENEIWYAMRATYRRELEAVKLLERERVGCFVPMQYKVSVKRGKKSVSWCLLSIVWSLSMPVLPR